jgi:hypothetical protein
LVDRFFNKIKQCRRVATRYDKLAADCLAFVQLASIRMWLRVKRVHALKVAPHGSNIDSLGRYALHGTWRPYSSPAHDDARINPVPSRRFDDLDPVRTSSHRITRRLAEPSARRIDPIDREPIRFLTGGDEVVSARIDIDAARLSLGGEIGDVGELARAWRHRKKRDLVGVALGRVEEFSVRRQAQIGGPDRRLFFGAAAGAAAGAAPVGACGCPHFILSSGGTEGTEAMSFKVPFAPSMAYCAT